MTLPVSEDNCLKKNNDFTVKRCKTKWWRENATYTDDYFMNKKEA